MLRGLDLILSLFGLIALSPLILIAMIAIYLQDYHSPFYIAPRVGRNEKLFSMVKLRSMIKGADKNKVDSTSSSDARITTIGKIIRKTKLDEIVQLWNVLTGSMSLVGPRPNVKREVDLYTDVEKKLLHIRPGVTDLASIVFSDEGDILKDSQDPDLDYNQLIRPWKSRLALLYVENKNLSLYFKLIYLTVLNSLSREKALCEVQKIVSQYSQDSDLISIASRKRDLLRKAPPGASEIVTSRGI